MGPAESTFGSIVDVDVDAEGRIHVFDRQGSSIRWFDRQGRHGGSAGRYGQGPGELKAPLAMDLDGQGRLHVLDAGNSRITTYERTERGLSYVADHRLDVYAQGICVAGQRRFLLTPRSELLFREIAADGSTIRTFGEPYEAHPALARQLPAGFPRSPLNGGQLLCDEARNLLVFMNTLMGEVRAYTLDGQLRWITDLPDFFEVELTYVERFGRCCRYGPNPESGTTHGILSGALVGDEILVSLHEYGRGGAVDRYDETRVLRARDGAYLGIRSYGMIVSAVDGDRIIGFTKIPYPRVLVVEP